MNAAQGSAFFDLQGLASLRAEAVATPSQAVEEVSAQFESLFVQMMVKSMRDATVKGGLFDSHQMDVYQGMFDQQVSLHLSRQGALGLSDILVEQLDGGAPAPPRAGGKAGLEQLGLLSSAAEPQSAPAMPVTGSRPDVAAAAASTAQPGAKVTEPAQQDWQPASPEEFIRSVWDHAVGAARRIGLDPLVLVAQSALETGWGKRVIQGADGRSSFNLFGIKAGNGWDGAAATVNTVEYRDGLAALERASFRVYDSLANSFEDYVDFLQSNPRYQQALEKVNDARDFLRELQGAGYATDPRYAEKIMGIMDTDAYRPVVENLKKFGNLSLNGGNG
ncbi:MAG: flagellar assembly peptidoglycan hydrolase FlgJ [Halioglobus sp.]